jgi:hypothetical protein
MKTLVMAVLIVFGITLAACYTQPIVKAKLVNEIRFVQEWGF